LPVARLPLADGNSVIWVPRAGANKLCESLNRAGGGFRPRETKAQLVGRAFSDRPRHRPQQIL